MKQMFVQLSWKITMQKQYPAGITAIHKINQVHLLLHMFCTQILK